MKQHGIRKDGDIPERKEISRGLLPDRNGLIAGQKSRNSGHGAGDMRMRTGGRGIGHFSHPVCKIQKIGLRKVYCGKIPYLVTAGYNHVKTGPVV